MWDRIKFLRENLRMILIAGVVFWLIIVISFQLTGLIDISARCDSRCVDFFKSILSPIKSADAADTISQKVPAPITISVVILP